MAVTGGGGAVCAQSVGAERVCEASPQVVHKVSSAEGGGPPQDLQTDFHSSPSSSSSSSRSCLWPTIPGIVWSAGVSLSEPVRNIWPVGLWTASATSVQGSG